MGNGLIRLDSPAMLEQFAPPATLPKEGFAWSRGPALASGSGTGFIPFAPELSPVPMAAFPVPHRSNWACGIPATRLPTTTTTSGTVWSPSSATGCRSSAGASRKRRMRDSQISVFAWCFTSLHRRETGRCCCRFPLYLISPIQQHGPVHGERNDHKDQGINSNLNPECVNVHERKYLECNKRTDGSAESRN